MYRHLRHFLCCSRGNVAFMAAGAALPLLGLIAGGMELAEYNRIKHSMQTAADAAALSAFGNSKLNIRGSIKRANALFDANFHDRHRVKSIKRKLSGSHRKLKIRMTYSASAKLNNLFGDINPLAGSKITVKSTAQYTIGSGKPPRLVGSSTRRTSFD